MTGVVEGLKTVKVIKEYVGAEYTRRLNWCGETFVINPIVVFSGLEPQPGAPASTAEETRGLYDRVIGDVRGAWNAFKKDLPALGHRVGTEFGRGIGEGLGTALQRLRPGFLTPSESAAARQGSASNRSGEIGQGYEEVKPAENLSNALLARVTEERDEVNNSRAMKQIRMLQAALVENKKGEGEKKRYLLVGCNGLFVTYELIEMLKSVCLGQMSYAGYHLFTGSFYGWILHRAIQPENLFPLKYTPRRMNFFVFGASYVATFTAAALMRPRYEAGSSQDTASWEAFLSYLLGCSLVATFLAYGCTHQFISFTDIQLDRGIKDRVQLKKDDDERLVETADSAQRLLEMKGGAPMVYRREEDS